MSAELARVSDEAASEETDTPILKERTWPVVLHLKHPFDFGSERVTSLEFRRGRAGDMKNVRLGDDLAANDIALIASRLCGRPVKVIDMLDMDDMGEVTSIALDFYARYLRTGGGKPSP